MQLALVLCALLVHGALSTSSPFKSTRFSVNTAVLPDVVAAGVTAVVRLGSGAFVDGYKISISSTDSSAKPVPDYSFSVLGTKFKETGPNLPWNKPKLPIELYEYEGCPFCRKVREAVNILDLDVVFYPCPRGGPTYRTKVLTTGGKAQFPYMVDPNTKTSMYESDDIIEYLSTKYGSGQVPWTLTKGLATTLSASIAMVFRLGKGSKFVEAKAPKKPLILWGYEASPFTKIVREVLCDLEIPHMFKPCTRGSGNRDALVAKIGFFQAPFIEDPNTGVAMLDSADIIEYLKKTYAVVA